MSAIVRQLQQKISIEGAHFDAILADLDLIKRRLAELHDAVAKAVTELPDAVAKAVVEELALRDRQGR